MTIDELIIYTNHSLNKSGLTLSDFAKSEMKKRYTKSENEGGYSEYWKNTSLSDAGSRRMFNIKELTNV
jgi:predicted nucleic-acid-binding Zn-ribbon protein